MKGKMLIAALAATLVTGIAASTSAAVPAPGDLKVVPGQQMFGWVVPGDSVVKPVTALNRTSETLYYVGAHWPNYDPDPSVWTQPEGTTFPYTSTSGFYGFWGVDSSFPCYTIDGKSSCAFQFQFKPSESGSFASYFQITYSTSYRDAYPSGSTWGTCHAGGFCTGDTYTSNLVTFTGGGLPH